MALEDRNPAFRSEILHIQANNEVQRINAEIAALKEVLNGLVYPEGNADFGPEAAKNAPVDTTRFRLSERLRKLTENKTRLENARF